MLHFSRRYLLLTCLFLPVASLPPPPILEIVADIVLLPLLQLPRSNKTCPKCNHEEAVFFQSQERSAETGMVSILLPWYIHLIVLTICLSRNFSTFAASAVTFSHKREYKKERVIMFNISFITTGS